MTDVTVIDEVLEAADEVRARLPEHETPSVLRGFAVVDHLDDRTKAALLELAKHVI